MEVESQSRVVSHISEDSLESVGSIRHRSCWTTCINEHRDCVVPVLWWGLLHQERPAVGWPALVSLLKEHIIDLCSLFEEVGAQVGFYRLHTGE